MTDDLTQLGRESRLPASPGEAELETVPNPHPDTDYLVRFAAPEFTSLCPITGQPDFAHLVIDYVPAERIVESKSLKLFLGAFRNHGAFHEACTVDIAKRLVAAMAPKWLAATGIRAAASPSTSSTRPASPPPASGSPRRRWPPIAAGGEGKQRSGQTTVMTDGGALPMSCSMARP